MYHSTSLITAHINIQINGDSFLILESQTIVIVQVLNILPFQLQHM